MKLHHIPKMAVALMGFWAVFYSICLPFVPVTRSLSNNSVTAGLVAIFGLLLGGIVGERVGRRLVSAGKSAPLSADICAAVVLGTAVYSINGKEILVAVFTIPVFVFMVTFVLRMLRTEENKSGEGAR